MAGPAEERWDLASELYVAITRLVRDLRREAPGDGVADSGLSVLFTLAKLGPSRVTTLAETEGVAAATMTRILDRVCDLGLAVRSPDPDDGRAHLVSLTRSGRLAVEEGRAARLAAVRRRLDALSAEDRRTLAAAVGVLGALGDR